MGPGGGLDLFSWMTIDILPNVVRMDPANKSHVYTTRCNDLVTSTDDTTLQLMDVINQGRGGIEVGSL